MLRYPFAPVCVLSLGCLLLSGCFYNDPGKPGTPANLKVALKWQPASGQAAAASVDSLSADVLDALGKVVAGPFRLTFDAADPTLFHGTVQAPAGTGRVVRVRAFSTGDEFYRGTSAPLTLTPGGSSTANVTMLPSMQLLAIFDPRSVSPGDSVSLSLAVRSQAASRGVQADILYDAAQLGFMHAIPVMPLPGFDAREVTVPGASGAVRVLAYGSTPSDSLPWPATVLLCTLRFTVCPGGGCASGTPMPVALGNVVISSRHGRALPVTLVPDTLEVK